MSEDPPEEEPKRRWRKPLDGSAAPRMETKRVRAKRNRTESSRKWIERQLNDPYVQRAKSEGYRARAAYKLIELDEKFQFLKKGARVCDLGAAPGGWAQVALKRGGARVVGIDLLAIDPLPPAHFLQMDFLSDDAEEALIEALGGPPDIVLSDMAANTTGHHRTDQMRTGALAEAAAHFALKTLAPGGVFVTKAFQGGLDSQLLAELKRNFSTVRHAKPPASRSESPEIYVVAQGYRSPAS